MRQGTDESFAKGAPVYVRRRHPKQTDLNFFLVDASPEELLNLLEGLQKGYAVKFVPDIGAFQYLKSSLLSRDKPE